MEFAETYRHQVIQSRRDRSRRALFWSRIVGIVLMLTIAAVLRADPDLRRALAIGGSDAILAMTGRSAPKAAQTPETGLPQSRQDTVEQETQVRVSARPRDRVKVNRPGLLDPAPQGPGTAADAESLANEIGAQLRDMKPHP